MKHKIFVLPIALIILFLSIIFTHYKWQVAEYKYEYIPVSVIANYYDKGYTECKYNKVPWKQYSYALTLLGLLPVKDVPLNSTVPYTCTYSSYCLNTFSHNITNSSLRLLGDAMATAIKTGQKNLTIELKVYVIPSSGETLVEITQYW